MRDIDQALDDIAAIRDQIARATPFRGYGPAALLATGLVAMIAAVVQSACIDDPANDIARYLGLWIVAALVAAAIIGVEMVRRSRRVHSALADDMVRAAVEEFMPAAGAGALLSLVIVRCAPQSLWMLPGLWQIILSLGVFAACRSLPRPMIAIGVWYLICGLACLALADGGSRAFSPWAMGLPFGAGQLLAAALLQQFGRDHAA